MHSGELDSKQQWHHLHRNNSNNNDDDIKRDCNGELKASEKPIKHAYVCIRLAKMGFRQKRRLRAHKAKHTRAHTQLASYCACEYECDRTVKHQDKIESSEKMKSRWWRRWNSKRCNIVFCIQSSLACHRRGTSFAQNPSTKNTTIYRVKWERWIRNKHTFTYRYSM